MTNRMQERRILSALIFISLSFAFLAMSAGRTDAALTPSVTLTASPTSIVSGQYSTLSWSSTNAASCTGVGFSTGNAGSGAVKVYPTVTTLYTINCPGVFGGSASSSVMVNVGASTTDTTPPSVPTGLTGSANSSSEIDLGWSSSSDNVGVIGYDVYRNGAKVGTSKTTSYTDTGLSASTTYTYTVDAYDGSGNTSAESSSISVTTESGSTTPTKPSVTFSASPSSITAGQSSTLSWSSANATSCTGTNFSANNATSGTQSVSPTVTTTYALSCAGPGGSTSASLSVAVSSSSPATFQIGAQVKTTAVVRVRNMPSTGGFVSCNQPAGASGTIQSGPRSDSGYTWWSVKFAKGCSGWVAQNYLALVQGSQVALESAPADQGVIARIESELLALLQQLQNIQSQMAAAAGAVQQ